MRSALLILMAALLLPSAGLQAAPRDRYAFDEDAALRRSRSVLGRPMGDYTVTHSDGRALRLASLRGKPLLVSFIYTGCFRVCPTTTRNLKRAFEAARAVVGSDHFNVLSVGFNLPFDTPEAMGSFAREQGVNLPNWYFVSVDQATLEGLARDMGFSYESAAGGFEHITQISVVDQQGRVYRQVYGDNFPLPQLVTPLKELITGAPPERETLAQLVERVRILCTVYDPATGRYRYKYSILLEIAGGVFSLSAVGVFLLRELRRRSRAATRVRSA